MPKQPRLFENFSATDKSDQGKSVLTAGARQTRATTTELQNQNESPAESVSIRVRKTAKTRESVVEDVKVICKDVEVTPTFCSSSAKKVSIWVGGKIVASIDDVIIG